MCRACQVVMMLAGMYVTGAAAEWRAVSQEEAVKLRAVMESALTSHWERCRRGWCRGTTIFFEDEQDFTCWWDGDRVGMEVTAVRPVGDRDPLNSPTQQHLSLYLPNEHWVYKPEQQLCRGNGGVMAQRLPDEFDVRPQKFWLTILGSSPKFSHLNLLRFLTDRGIDFQIVVDETGLVAFDAEGGRLVLDPQRGFAPVLYESGLKRGDDKSTPLREAYELAQDRHGEWYCRRRVHTRWRNGLDQAPTIFAPAEVVEYDSRPAPELLRLSFESLKLPVGTRVESSVRSRPGTWAVGREKEGLGAVTEERLRVLGKTMRTRGFAEEPSR
jgi:hypothetical protein